MVWNIDGSMVCDVIVEVDGNMMVLHGTDTG